MRQKNMINLGLLLFAILGLGCVPALPADPGPAEDAQSDGSEAPDPGNDESEAENNPDGDPGGEGETDNNPGGDPGGDPGDEGEGDPGGDPGDEGEGEGETTEPETPPLNLESLCTSICGRVHQCGLSLDDDTLSCDSGACLAAMESFDESVLRDIGPCVADIPCDDLIRRTPEGEPIMKDDGTPERIHPFPACILRHDCRHRDDLRNAICRVADVCLDEPDAKENCLEGYAGEQGILECLGPETLAQLIDCYDNIVEERDCEGQGACLEPIAHMIGGDEEEGPDDPCSHACHALSGSCFDGEDGWNDCFGECEGMIERIAEDGLNAIKPCLERRPQACPVGEVRGHIIECLNTERSSCRWSAGVQVQAFCEGITRNCGSGAMGSPCMEDGRNAGLRYIGCIQDAEDPIQCVCANGCGAEAWEQCFSFPPDRYGDTGGVEGSNHCAGTGPQ